MRDIKFRSFQNGEMLYQAGEGNYAISRFIGFINEKSPIMQFTGLLDKKGNRIFEGDIVDISHPCWTAKCEVKFVDGAFFFIEKDNPINNSQIRADKFLKQKWEIEVIGNIHQNPELLNQ